MMANTDRLALNDIVRIRGLYGRIIEITSDGVMLKLVLRGDAGSYVVWRHALWCELIRKAKAHE